MNNDRKMFYGWWIAIAGGVAFCLGSAPILVFSFPVFLKALTKEFQASRSAISLAFSLHNIVAAVGAPLFGRLIDRVGSRRVIIPGTILFAILLIGNSVITGNIFGIYLFNIAGALLGPSCGIGYFAIVSKWFDKRRGSALAVLMTGTGIGAVVMPSVAQRLITAFGWRAAYSIYGCAVLLVPLPIIIAVLRETPEDMALLPDGAPPSLLSSSNTEVRAGLTWRETRRTQTFWFMVSAFFLLGASVHACIIHLAAMLTDRGISAQTAALASSVVGFGVLTGRLVTGLLLDKYPGVRVAVGFSSGAAFGMLLLLIGRGPAAFAGALLVGLGIGAEGDLIGYLTSRYFGLKAFGELYGYAFGIFVLAGACGALVMGIGFDKTGSYTAPLLLFLTAIFVAIILFSRLGPYRYGVLEASSVPASLKMSATAS